jgi:transposase
VTLTQKCSALCKDLHNRKNWIHFGSQQAGPRIAAILSIVETCRRLQIPIRDYLPAILPGLDDLSVRRVAELTPTAWSARP